MVIGDFREWLIVHWHDGKTWFIWIIKSDVMRLPQRFIPLIKRRLSVSLDIKNSFLHLQCKPGGSFECEKWTIRVYLLQFLKRCRSQRKLMVKLWWHWKHVINTHIRKKFQLNPKILRHHCITHYNSKINFGKIGDRRTLKSFSYMDQAKQNLKSFFAWQIIKLLDWSSIFMTK